MPLPPRSTRPTVVVDVEGGFSRGESGAAQIQAKTVKLLHATRRVKELPAVTKLNRVLETVDSDEEAQR